MFQKMRPGIRSLERSAKCAPNPGSSARSLRRVWTLRAFQITERLTISLAAQTGHTLATHTAMSDPGGPAGPAVPSPAPAATVWPQGADPSKAKRSKLSFARASQGAVAGAERRALCGDQHRKGCCKGR